MSIDKKQEIQRLLNALDPDRLSKEDFINMFEQVVKLVLEIQQRQQKAIEDLERTYTNLLSKMDNDHSTRFQELKGKVDHVFVKDRVDQIEGGMKAHMAEIRQMINEIINKKLGEVDNRMSKVKDGPQGIQGIPGPIGPMPTEHLELMKEVRAELTKVKNVLSNIPRGKAMGRAKVPIMRPVNLTSSVDGSARSFTLPPDTTQVIGVWGSQFPFTLDRDNDWTLSGNTLTLGDQVATPQAGQTLWVLCEVLFYP